MSDYYEKSLKMHEEHRGKLEVVSRVSVANKEDLSIAYTPGVAGPCLKIHENKLDAYKYTIKSHTIAVVSDGTAVLGLGDIGPEAAMPVMEGKSILFKEFGNVDAVPICLDTKDTEEIIKTVKYLAPTFGGINLEDISSPRCFEIETRLKQELDIPVFHDDQHGTAIVLCAALMNALKIIGKKWEDLHIVIGGSGAAGIAIAKLLMQMNPADIILTARRGALEESEEWMNPAQREIAKITNKNHERGSLSEVIKGKDVFIGVSGPNVLTYEDVKTMNSDACIFALANPVPEIMPEDAKRAGARIIATGRSDYPNQVNNVLVFPGLFKGALMVEASKIVEEMKIAAARAIASLVSEEELNEDYIIPSPFDRRVADVVANEVAMVAENLGIARKPRQ